jgi:hypothetical protein
LGRVYKSDQAQKEEAKGEDPKRTKCPNAVVTGTSTLNQLKEAILNECLVKSRGGRWQREEKETDDSQVVHGKRS